MLSDVAQNLLAAAEEKFYQNVKFVKENL